MSRESIDQIDQEYLEALRRGDAPDRKAIVESHPEIARWLEEHLDLLDALHGTRSGSPMPRRVGPYLIREVLGEGGMALVYLAYQTDPVRRPVAIKLIKKGMDTRDFVARFETERQALALMQHPGIAKVFDGGATEQGRPYFVMEYVQGMPITEYCDHRRLPVPERLRIFREVCDAVQHAHQKGIIHRDLKPSNILITESSGRPIPKVIDFGIAKAVGQRLTKRPVFTDHGRIIGTVEYMSPEQAAGSAHDMDTRADIYSLGVILYELLVGVLPFDMNEVSSAGIDEIRRKIREEDPPRPSARSRSLRGDLDWIILKAMEKEPSRRYASASELAADITRHLRDEPVLACPPSPLYRMGKFVRKHRVMVAAAGVVAITLVAGIAVSTAQYLHAERQGRRAPAGIG